MLWTLIKKEMLANVTSLRFAMTLLLVAVVFIVSGFVFVGKYNQEIQDFSEVFNKNLAGLEEASNNLSRIPNYVQVICRRPRAIQLCCEGFEKSIPNTFRMSGFTMHDPESMSRTNFLFPRFADVDWTFIISLILSFIALLMTFDSFSAERERGTLRMVMSNSIPRDKVILAKYVSGMLTLMIPLSVGLLLNLVIVSFSGLSFTGSGQWVKILVFIGISILYLSIFVLLGILVSSRNAKSSSSIVVLLFIWVIIAMIIPSAGRMAAERFVTIPTRSEIERQISEAGREIWENSERYGRKAGSWSSSDPNYGNPSARARLFNAIADSGNSIREEYVNRMAEQVSFGRNVTRVSPTVIYQCASEAIIGTGTTRFLSLYNQLKRYRGTLRDFVMTVDKGDPNSFHLWAEGRQHQVLLSQEPVDYNAIPRFEEIDASLSLALENAMWDIGALALLNLLLFMGVYISFLRSDVR